MSQMGQIRKSAVATAMSAFPPIATKLRTSREVRFVPTTVIETDWTALGLAARKQRGKDVDARGVRL